MKRNLLLFLFLGTIGVLAVSWYPEGDAPQRGDNEQRSLQKINNLLYTSVSPGSGGTAPSITNATIVTYQGLDGTVTDNAVRLGVALGLVGAGDTYYVRYLTIYWREDNGATVYFGPTGSGTYRPLTPGQEYVFTVPAGAKLDLNSIRIWCPVAATSGGVSVMWLQ